MHACIVYYIWHALTTMHCKEANNVMPLCCKTFITAALCIVAVLLFKNVCTEQYCSLSSKIHILYSFPLLVNAVSNYLLLLILYYKVFYE